MKKIIYYLPLVILFCVCFFLLIYLLEEHEPNKPPSALIGKELPNLQISNLFKKNEYILQSSIKNNFVLINFFASWCAPCKVEHPLFFEIKKTFPNLVLLGIAHKDKINDTEKYLDTEGNPYTFVGMDKDGSIGLELGVFGLPETFLVNDKGIIIYKKLGPISKKIIKNEIKPFLQ